MSELEFLKFKIFQMKNKNL